MKKFFIIGLLILISACANIPSYDEDYLNDYNARFDEEKFISLTFFNAGQGDAILLESKGQTMLIDSGNEWLSPILYEHIKSYNLNLEYVLITHYHMDHLGGLKGVVAGPDGELSTIDDLWPGGGFLDRGSENAEDSIGYAEYEDLSNGRRTKVRSGDIYRVGDSTVEIVAENYENKYGERVDFDKFDENSASIVALVKIGKFKCLLTGDITGGGGDPPHQTVDVESLIAEDVGDVDCLKVGHHGSKTSTNQFFVNNVLPDISIISVGNDNDYGHPSDAVIDRLVESGSRVIATQIGISKNKDLEVANSNIVITADENGLIDVIY